MREVLFDIVILLNLELSLECPRFDRLFESSIIDTRGDVREVWSVLLLNFEKMDSRVVVAVVITDSRFVVQEARLDWESVDHASRMDAVF